MFLQGGNYSTWSSRNGSADGKRIVDVIREGDGKDEEFGEIETRFDGDQAGKRNAIKKLITKRNSQLSRFLQHIANYTHFSEQDDICNNSTSVSWIWKYLERHYDIETRGSKFLDIASITPKEDVNPNTFYKEVRARVFDNLRRKDDTLPYSGNKILTEDETLTPTLECFIVMYALEKIDPRLPGKIQKDYGHRMQENVTLIDLASEIFQNVRFFKYSLEEINWRNCQRYRC